MFNRTECDLSYGKATLDFEALHKTAALGYRYTWHEVQRLYNQLHEVVIWTDTTKLRSAADDLASATEHLAYIAETLSALNGARERSELIISNKAIKLEITTE